MKRISESVSTKILKSSRLRSLRLGKDQDAFHEDNRLRINVDRAVGACVYREVVDRNLHRLPIAQALDVFNHQRRIQRVGMIEVDRRALVRRKIVEFTIVCVMG